MDVFHVFIFIDLQHSKTSLALLLAKAQLPAQKKTKKTPKKIILTKMMTFLMQWRPDFGRFSINSL